MQEKNSEKKVVTRFAPSPTGLPHLGTAMYALLNYLYARQNNGEVIMRSEDTDPVRSKPEYEKAIIDGLAWLGIKADKFYRQSERKDIYKKYIAKMVADGTAYISPEKNEKGEMSNPVRFKNPNKVVTFHDMARGDISVNTTELKDFVIARSLESPLYHLTVVIDDYEMGVTHIIRGEDGLANTPRQILIQEAIDATMPVYAHYPFVLLPNRTKMGKRNGAVSLQDYMKKSYLPEAIVNFIILMVWHPKDDRELFTMEDLVKEFELERIGKGGAIFDEKKLDWLNREYIKKLTDQEFIEKAKVFIDFISPASELELDNLILGFRDRIAKFSDLNEFIGGNSINSSIVGSTEHIINPSNNTLATSSKKEKNTLLVSGPNDYLFPLKDPIIQDMKLLIPKDLESKIVVEYLKSVKDLIEKISWDKIIEKNDEDKDNLWSYATKEGRGKVLWPLRVALSGQQKSPDPFEIMKSIGKEATLRRIDNAILQLKINLL